MSDIVALRRQLKIKSGVVKRLTKENRLYTKEVEDNRLKVEKFKADGAEDWDIKNGTRLVEESQKMVKDTEVRLGTSVGELRDLVNEAEKIAELQTDEELLQAKEALEAASL
ncbi:tubulin binding cofactor A [Artomyces pyxidatus]|uniref:Tubulin binding cofactor A n=1 Tax=Artomyces pyxidatus TaxID=48021 RepID=A0ACB8SZS1_9AGAM|nr:tubulin binding cofactor A [Artomyces pyxidatus]